MSITSNESLIKKLRKDMILEKSHIIKAFYETPRRFFVPKNYAKEAYEDYSIPLGIEQSILKPSYVALMTELLDIKRCHDVLVIGTGSGWHTAIMSKIVGEHGNIFSIELDKKLFEFSKKNLEKVRAKNTRIFLGDGTKGMDFPEKKSAGVSKINKNLFDRILLTGAVPDLPYPLKEQLKKGGKILAPIGNQFTQQIIVFGKTSTHMEEIKKLGYFKLEPLKGIYGFKTLW